MKELTTISDKNPTEEAKVEFEHALGLTGVGRFNYILCALCTFINVVAITELFGISYIVASGGCDMNLTPKTKGLVAAMPMLGIVASAHLWGWLTDTRGRRTVLLISMWGSFVFGFISSFSINWIMLACTKFLAAFFVSASVAVTFTLCGECTPISNRNQFVLLISTGSLLAEGFMTLNAYPVLYFSFDVEILPKLHYKPWRLLQQFYSFWCLVNAVLVVYFVKESPKFLASQGFEDQSIKVLSEIYAANTRNDSTSYTVKSIYIEEPATTFSKDRNFLISMWEQTIPLFQSPYLFKTLLVLYLFAVVVFVCPSFLMWLPSLGNIYAKALAEENTKMSICTMFQNSHLNDDLKNSTLELSTCDDKLKPMSFITMFIFAIILTILNTVIYYVMKFISKKALCISIHVIGAACGFALPWIPNINTGMVLFIFFQINLICYGLIVAFAVDFFPTHLRAMAICLMMMIGRGISFVGITYVGMMMGQHCEVALNGLGAILISGALVSLLLPSETKQEDVNTTSTKS